MRRSALSVLEFLDVNLLARASNQLAGAGRSAEATRALLADTAFPLTSDPEQSTLFKLAGKYAHLRRIKAHNGFMSPLRLVFFSTVDQNSGFSLPLCATGGVKLVLNRGGSETEH